MNRASQPGIAHPRASRTGTPCTSYHTSNSQPLPLEHANSNSKQRLPPIQISSTSQLVEPIHPSMLISRRSSSPLPASITAARRIEIAARSISTGAVRAPLPQSSAAKPCWGKGGISQELVANALQGLSRVLSDSVTAAVQPSCGRAAVHGKAWDPETHQEVPERHHSGALRESEASMTIDYSLLQEARPFEYVSSMLVRG